MRLPFIILLSCLITVKQVTAQKDSLEIIIAQSSSQYILSVDKKISRYRDQLEMKTIRTLHKLARWEKKIKALVQMADPETARKLFDENPASFTKLLEQLESASVAVRKTYDAYTEKLKSGIGYLDQQKAALASSLTKQIRQAKENMTKLDESIGRTESLHAAMGKRKKELFDLLLKYAGTGKWFKKINKETWYYVNELKNLKANFSEPGKAEATLLSLLEKTPAFRDFMKKNSLLSSLFGNGLSGNIPAIAGLQSRQSISNLLPPATTASTASPFTLGMQEAQNELKKMKDNITGVVGGKGKFRINQQKNKPFRKRLEFNTNIQFSKNNSWMPGMADIGIQVGYKFNDRLVAGIGTSYKLGLGNPQRIRLSTQGIGLRSFIQHTLKKQFHLAGGLELNYLPALNTNSVHYAPVSKWQRSALAGITKKIKMKSRFAKSTSLQLYFDFLNRQHIPVSQPWLFRIGYDL